MKKSIVAPWIVLLCLLTFVGLAETIVIDNKSADYTTTGSWTEGSYAGYHVTNYHFTDTVTGTATHEASWSPTLSSSGTYEVFVWYVEGTNRPTDAEYTVNHSSGSTTVYVDQTTNGSQWYSLGSYSFPASGGSVVLSNHSSTSGKAVIADAVKLVRSGTSYGDLYQGMWIYAWGAGILSESQTNTMISTARDNYLNIIFPQVRKTGDAYYISATEPRGTNIDPTYEDPLADILQKAHDTSGGKQFIEVHAWIVPYRVWNTSLGDYPTSHVLAEHPEWKNETYNGDTQDSGGNTYLDPGVPDAMDYVVDVVKEIVQNYDVDGIHFDYIRYPGNTWGYNTTAINRFNTLYGKAGKPSTSDPDFCDFRRDQIFFLARKAYVAVKEIDWDCKMSAATVQWGSYGGDFTATSAYTSVFQDWPKFMSEGAMDMNVLMNYKREHLTDQAQDYRDWCNFLASSKAGRHAVNGPGVYMNSIENSVTQTLFGMDTTGIDGTNFYVYHMTNMDGDPADDFWYTMRADCYTQQRNVPAASWLDSPPHGILKGYVTSGSTDLDGATVTLSDGATDQSPADGTGFYAFLKLAPGSYTATASATGYNPLAKPVTITAGTITTVNFDLTLVPVELSEFTIE